MLIFRLEGMAGAKGNEAHVRSHNSALRLQYKLAKIILVVLFVERGLHNRTKRFIVNAGQFHVKSCGFVSG